VPRHLKHPVPDFTTPKYENLILSLQNGTCIFTGAGVSKLAGYKLWDELKHEMVDYFWDNKGKLTFTKSRDLDLSLCETLKTNADIIDTFDYLYLLDKSLFTSGIKSIFYATITGASNKVFEALNQLNNGKNIFVSTNIDDAFQKYMGLTDDAVSIYPTFRNPLSLITYLHGRIDLEHTWIFTRSQYNKGYVDTSAPCLNLLVDIFKNYNVLFLGYGLREDDIERAISLTNKRKTHYWIEGSTRNVEDSLKIRSTTLKENYNINLIPYYIDADGQGLLCEVISSLSKIMTI
jgi:hypothetical protein